jgi:DNA-binding LacI/PurR family transcriptional regulator
MKIIVLEGESDVGKTNILNLVYDTLTNTGKATVRVVKERVLEGERDFETVLKMKGKTVAIYTMGDLDKELIEAVKKYDSQKVDFLIIACSANMAKAKRFIKKYDPDVIVKEKYPNDDQKAIDKIIKLLR